MNRPFSTYLDFVRFGAAFLVYLYHSNQRWLVAERLPASDYGHSSVIVFFVLSGCVIGYVTDTKERDWMSYAASRISRIYSVVLPAVFITVALDAVGRSLSPQVYGYPFDHFAIRVAASLALCNEIWLVSITNFSNVPYWSICYEGWYYVAFGLLTFLRPPWRYGAPAILALLLGPKILLLAPIWAAGVVLYRWQALRTLSMFASVSMAVLSIAGIAVFHLVDAPSLAADLLKKALGPELQKELTFSKFFLADYVLGLLVFCNFAGMRRVCAAFPAPFLAVARPVQFLAGFTFTLYLLHQPLFLFWGAIIRGNPSTHAYWFAVTVLTLLSVGLIGHFTESRRHLLRDWLLRRALAAREALVSRGLVNGR